MVRIAFPWGGAFLMLVGGLALAVVGSDAAAQGVGPHFGGGVLAGNAAGLDDGYVHFGGFLPLVRPSDSSLFFADGSLLLYNDGADALGGNAGLGARFFCPELDRIFGGYAYYDQRDLGFWQVDQVGFGLETLGRMWDARLNVNLPTSNGPGLTGVQASFVGNSIVLNGLEMYSLSVVEAELGALLAEHKSVQWKGFAGVYGLIDDAIEDAAGVRGRLEARVKDKVWFGAYLEHDRVFDTTGGFTCEWRFGKGKCRCESSQCNLLARLGDPVVRRRHVALSRTAYAGTPLTNFGTPINVLHVDDGPDIATGSVSLSSVSPAGISDGSIEHPFETLDDASDSTADVIYIHSGEYIDQTLVVTHSGQQVLGPGVAATVSGSQGAFVFAGGPAAIIRNAGASGVQVDASNVTVQGLTFDAQASVVIDSLAVTPASDGGYGVFSSSGADGLRVLDNRFYNMPGGAVFLNGPSSGLIARNVMTSVHSGVYVEGAFTGDVIDNVVAGAPNGMLTVHGDFTGDILRNQAMAAATAVDLDGDFQGEFAHNSLTASYLGAYITGSATGDIHHNVFNGNSTGGLFVVGDVNGNVLANQASDNSGGYGLSINGNVSGELADNIVNGNGQNGLQIAGAVVGSVRGNVANDNAASGFYLSSVGGDLAYNETSRNGENGVYIDFSLAGDMRNNLAADNGERGLFVWDDVLGDVRGNHVTGNGYEGVRIGRDVRGDIVDNDVSRNYDGIYVAGDMSGDVRNNVASDNDIDGFYVSGFVDGSILDNTMVNNGGYGIYVLGEISGDVMRNTV
ncbi:MAG: right-handed parallel beta-helix repeat-containing protein, partial [Planctomycetales bacterium]|nr:right-handed parallel beta-helix repeat-containing protein [Planctomycetales bacterium]